MSSFIRPAAQSSNSITSIQQQQQPVGAISSTSNSNPSSSATTSFRHLVWDSTIPICVELDASTLSAGKPPVESFYTTLPRLSYLPLLLPTLRSNLVELALEPHLAATATSTEQDWWFEYQGQPLRWHWPIGLLYDYHTSNRAPSNVSASDTQQQSSSPSSYFPSSTSPNPTSQAQRSSPDPTQFFSIKLHLKSPPLDKLGSTLGNTPLQTARTAFMSMLKEADFVRYGSTRRVGNLRKREQEILWEGVVDHEFEKFWSVASKIVPLPSNQISNESTHPSPSRAPSLNLSLSGTSTNTNGTNSVNSNSANEQATTNDRSKFSTVSSTSTARPGTLNSGFPTFNESQVSLNPSIGGESSLNQETGSKISHNSGNGSLDKNDANAVRSVPVRVHLKDCPVVQEPISPIQEGGSATTLHQVLTSLFPLLFPPKPSFSSFQPPSPPLAFPVIQGIRVPLEAEVGWLGSTLCNAEGWVTVVLILYHEGEALNST